MKSLVKKIPPLVLISTSILLIAGCQTLSVQDNHTSLPIDPAVTYGKLENGLTYYIRKHGKPENRAALWLAVNAGSILEDDDQRGLAHFVEHMAFNGTERFEKNSMIDFAERAGIDFGADLNAYTSYDETVYMLTVPTDDKNTLATGLDIIHDWSHALSFDPEEVDKERGVVIEEWRRGRSARQRASEVQTALLLDGSKYVDRSPIGEKEILETAPAQTLRRYYDDWYRPDLMAVIIVGDVNPEQIVEELRQRFNQLETSNKSRRRDNIEIPINETTRVKVFSDAELSQSSLTLAYKAPPTPVTDKTEYRQSLVEELFVSMLDERFESYQQDPDSPVLRLSSNIRESGRDVDLFQVRALTKPGQIESSLERIMYDLENVRRYGFTLSELSRQKEALMRFYDRAYQEREKTESSRLAQEIVRHYLNNETMPGITIELELVNELLPDISIEEVNELAEDWLDRKDKSVFASGPVRDIDTSEQDLLKIVSTANQVTVEPYQDNIVTEKLFDMTPAKGKVINEEYVEAIDSHIWTLSNGARIVIKQTDFKNDEIQFQVISPGGLSLVSDDFYQTANAATNILAGSGIGNLNERDLNNVLTGKAVQVRTYVGETEEGLYGNASPVDFETLLQLIHLKFTSQRADSDAFQIWKNRVAISIQNKDLRPEQLFSEEYYSLSNNHHPRSLPLELNDLDVIDPVKAYEFLKNRFADASDFTFFFVGNIDLQQFKAYAETYLASIPANNQKEQWQDSGMTRPEGIKSLNMEKGTDPKSQVRITWHGDVQWSHDVEMDLDLLEQIADTRLREVLREDMGGVYGVSTRASFYRQPDDRYTLSVSFTCAPENVESLRQAVFDVFEALKKQGIGEDYLEKAREIQKRNLETNLQNNRFWLAQLVRHLRYGMNPGAIIEQQHKKIERISFDNLKQAAELFIGENRIDGILMPESQ